MYKIIKIIILCLALFFSLLPLEANANALRVETMHGADIIDLDIGKKGASKIFFLNNPPRLVVDTALPKQEESAKFIALPSEYKGGLIKSVRLGRFDEDTLRIVFDLYQECKLTSSEQDGDIITLAITPDDISTDKLQTDKNKTTSLKLSSSTTKKSQKSQKSQLPIIVIDAGHGGNDPGAIGEGGTQEKDIVLAFAIALKNSLMKSGKYRVVMTRESDVFISLRERVKIARAAKGDVFISLHADSAPAEEVRGLSIYTLSEKASDAQTAALAEKENKADILGGIDLSNEREDVADILISLAQRETRNQSSMLADILSIELEKRVRMLSNPHRFAGFAVLKAPDIPSVLVETGFISHPKEEKLLKTKDYRANLINAIVKGLDLYFLKQKKKE